MIAEIDTFLESEIAAGGPGAAVAVVKDGEIVHSKGYGMANLAWQNPVTPDTVFRLASITKQFTATAIMMLQAEGKLSVDDPVTAHLPDFSTQGHHITLHHLLTHTSGLFNYSDPPPFDPGGGGIKIQWERQDRAPDEMCQFIGQLPFNFAPGAQYRYNNSGYYLLGAIVEKIAGVPFGAYVEQRIFEPLGMAQSCYFRDRQVIAKYADGYTRTANGYEHPPYTSSVLHYAAGGLASTVEDLARWDLALASGAPVDAGAQAQMYTSATLDNGEPVNYGYGFGINDYRGHHNVHHAGHMHGVSTFIVRFLDDALTVITLSNLDGFPVEKVSAKVAAHMLGLPQAEHPALTLDAVAAARCAGTYVYDARFPFPAKVLPREGGLALQFDRRIDLAPASESVFYEVDYPEFTVTFDEEANGRFTRLTMRAPFANDRSFYRESQA